MGTWTCGPCNREFVSQAARASHINHSLRHPRCEPCKRGFLDEASKLQHMRSSVAHRHTFCERCDRHFVSPYALEQHQANASAHRHGDIVETTTDSEAGWDTDGHPALFPVNGSDDETGSSRGESSVFRPTSEDEDVSFRFHPFIAEYLTRSTYPTPAVSTDASGSESSDVGESGGYLDASSASSEEEEVDSEFLEQSSDSESDASGTPLSLTSDPHRSTITRAPIPRPSGSSQDTSVPERRASISPATSASSCTLASEFSPTKPGSRFPKRKPRASGSGYTCPLCLEQDRDPSLELSSVKCGHVFCTPCITRALERKRQCPICRTRARTRHLRRIFLTF